MTQAEHTALAEDQRLLMDLISGRQLARHHRFGERGLRVYRANRAVLAERTLASTYPVIYELLGRETFEPLAQDFWQHHPPQRGDIAQWGASLAAFLEAAPQLAEEPFLGDVARVEWALHLAASVADAPLDAASFSLLAEADDAQPIGLVISQSAFTLASLYPVVSIVNAHLVAQPPLAVAADLLRRGQEETALVWRHGFKPKLRASTRAEHGLIVALLAGLSLESALEQALTIQASFDFNAWLGEAVQTGLITGAKALDPVTGQRIANECR